MSNLGIEKLSVLLVEPSLTQRKIVEGYLSQLGVKYLSHVSDGKSALEQLAASDPDLLISTLYLPDMTGTDLLHAIREDSTLSQTPFILISSETRFRYLNPIRQAGVVAILPKPFDIDALKVALNSTLDLAHLEPEELEVLIVDDSALSRKYIRKLLSGMGIERTTDAANGVEAVELLADRFFDLVITDYNMPQMDGKELVDHIRCQSNQSTVPVLMITSEDNESRLAAVQKSGVSAICDKPFEPTTVKQLLEQLL